MKDNLKLKILKRFPNITFSKIILYRNPNEFTNLYIERVNPNHIGIIWGKRHKKQHKGTHYIMCGKVYFTLLPVIVGLTTLGFIDAFTGYVYGLLLSIGLLGVILGLIVSLIFYGLPIVIYDKTEVNMKDA